MFYVEAELPDSGPTMVAYCASEGEARKIAVRTFAEHHCDVAIYTDQGDTVAVYH